MKKRVLINFATTPEKKSKYLEASKVIGISISEICRRALDNSVILSETLKTSTPSIPVPGRIIADAKDANGISHPQSE